MFDYGYQKEATGFSVWSLKPHSGDKRDHIRDVKTRSEARRVIECLRANAARRAVMQAVTARLIASGAPIISEKTEN